MALRRPADNRERAPQERKLITGGDPEEIYSEIPTDQLFEDTDAEYIDDTGLRDIGMELMANWLLHLKEIKIQYLWKRKGGTHAGKAILGRAVRPSGLCRFFCPADCVVWLAADHNREIKSTRYQIEAEIYHELLHIEGKDNDGNVVLRGHDWEGFGLEVEIYGAWRPDLQKAGETFKQLVLL